MIVVVTGRKYKGRIGQMRGNLYDHPPEKWRKVFVSFGRGNSMKGAAAFSVTNLREATPLEIVIYEQGNGNAGNTLATGSHSDRGKFDRAGALDIAATASGHCDMGRGGDRGLRDTDR